MLDEPAATARIVELLESRGQVAPLPGTRPVSGAAPTQDRRADRLARKRQSHPSGRAHDPFRPGPGRASPKRLRRRGLSGKVDTSVEPRRGVDALLAGHAGAGEEHAGTGWRDEAAGGMVRRGGRPGDACGGLRRSWRLRHGRGRSPCRRSRSALDRPGSAARCPARGPSGAGRPVRERRRIRQRVGPSPESTRRRPTRGSPGATAPGRRRAPAPRSR